MTTKPNPPVTEGMKLSDYWWVLRNEPNRWLKALFYKYPWKKRWNPIKEAFRYVWENPPCFDSDWEKLQKSL